MNTLEDEVVYVAHHNDEVTGAVLLGTGSGDRQVKTFSRLFNVEGWREEPISGGFGLYQVGGSFFEFSDVTLESAALLFPHTKRTFKTLDNLTVKVKEMIEMADNYEVNTEPEEVISFTVSSSGGVASVIKVTDDGTLSTFDQGDWREIADDDEDPDIFELEVIDIEPEDIEAALNMWKSSQESGTPLTKEEMLPFAALTQ